MSTCSMWFVSTVLRVYEVNCMHEEMVKKINYQ